MEIDLIEIVSKKLKLEHLDFFFVITFQLKYQEFTQS
jgi:hypothetical protein